MKVLHVDPVRISPLAIDEAAKTIRRGGLVAFPTETVYGLGADALNREAIARIYAAKGRPANNPLIVHCGGIEDARRLSREWPGAAELLAGRFWPGPLTLVVPKSSLVPDEVTAGLKTVALRVPSHPIAEALLKAAGVPIAAPSANRFTELSPTAGAHVIKSLGERADLLLDGGPTFVGIESTVVDVSGEEVVLLRPGSISREQLEEALEERVRSPGDYVGDVARPSPGMLARHYSPRAKLVLVRAGDDGRMDALAAEAVDAGERVAALVRGHGGPASANRLVRMPAEAADYARALYDTLHNLDDEDFTMILVEEVPESGQWAAVRDRLKRAATES